MKAKLTITRIIEIPESTDSTGSTPGDILDSMIVSDDEEMINSVEFDFTNEEIASARKTILRRTKR